jgi:hypothetical protein
MRRTLLSGLAFLFFLSTFSILLLTPRDSEAVPSFSRQTGKSCAACHTVWPRLTKYGREFKLTTFTDVDPKLDRIKGTGLDIPRVLPLSVRLINWPYTKRQDSKDETEIPHEAEIFFGGRLSPNAGFFAEIEWEDGEFSLAHAKVGFSARANSTIYGVMLGLMDPGGADPYNVLGVARLTRIRPLVLAAYRGVANRFDMTADNQGVVGHVFVNNMVYGALGVFRGAGKSDPIDFWGRAALELPVGAENNIAVGAFVYSGKEEYATWTGKLDRWGLDFQYQRESGPHIIEFTALYLNGTEKNVDGTGVTRDHNGIHANLAYYLNRKYGVMVSYDLVDADELSRERKAWTLRAEYLPWMNVKIGLEYTDYQKFGTLADPNDRNQVTFIVDLAF